MGRGARSTVRWKHDRIRRKKVRDKRQAAAGHVVTTAADVAIAATAATPATAGP
jgi:hypothetical protein